MKYKFDSTFLELGFLKELLKEFNLPNMPVATDDTKLYPGMLYVKNLGIYKCQDNGKLKKICDYYYNRPVFNLTRKMSVTTSYYSTDFHEYLGEYLRFLRDYKKLNLMSLYNCFSNRVITPSLYDENYNYYAVPVKFGQVYTVGFDSTTPVEIYCTLWNNVSVGDDINLEHVNSEGDIILPLDKLKVDTLDIITGAFLNKPFIYTKLKNLDATDYIKQWDSLRLIIKMPQTNNTSITVLEGDYIFDTVIDSKITSVAIFNRDIKDPQGKDIYHTKTYPTDLSLFKVNDSQKHPFADRLLEYLFDTAITQVDKLEDNVKRTQEFILRLTGRWPEVLYGIWDPSMNDNIYMITNNSRSVGSLRYYIMEYVKDRINHIVFDSEGMSQIEYDELYNKLKVRNLGDNVSDLLMYVDKDVEGLFLSTGVDENEYVR